MTAWIDSSPPASFSRSGSIPTMALRIAPWRLISTVVVLVADAEGEEVVFANIAGAIDLAAIAALGETFEIPGLDQVGK
ncbi:MAG: hypothetical protein ACYTFI_06690, partial [Planctomycetota bacterium]|jgi:hypothetical protein